eukprot:RCo007573
MVSFFLPPWVLCLKTSKAYTPCPLPSFCSNARRVLANAVSVSSSNIRTTLLPQLPALLLGGVQMTCEVRLLRVLSFLTPQHPNPSAVSLCSVVRCWCSHAAVQILPCGKRAKEKVYFLFSWVYALQRLGKEGVEGGRSFRHDARTLQP